MVSMTLWRNTSSAISWFIFTEELITHDGDIKSNTLFSQLVNHRQKGSVIKHIQQFQKLYLKVKITIENNLLDLFMWTLKEGFQHDIHLSEPRSLKHAFNMARKVESKTMTTRKLVTNSYWEYHALSPKLTRFTPLLDERRSKGICLNCDNKYIQGHTCSENKLFYIRLWRWRRSTSGTFTRFRARRVLRPYKLHVNPYIPH